MGAEEKPSLILLNYQVPGITGIEVLSKPKKDSEPQEIPVIIISATENIEEIAKSHSDHVVLKKPLDLKDLMEAIYYFLMLQKWQLLRLRIT